MNMEFNISNVAYIEIIETSDTAAVMRISSDSNWQCSCFLFYWTCFSLFSNKAVINRTTDCFYFILIKI